MKKIPHGLSFIVVLIFEHVHNPCFCDRSYCVIKHATVKHFFYILSDSLDVIPLHEVIYIASLLSSCILVDGDKLELGLIPLHIVTLVIIDKEYLMIVGGSDVLHLVLTRDLRLHLLGNFMLRLAKAQRIDNIQLRYFFLLAILLHLFVLDLDLKPISCSISHGFDFLVGYSV